MADSESPSDSGFLRVEFKNTQPVELSDLAGSLTALGESYEDYAVAREKGPPSGVRLYIQELRSGSIIADLVQLMDQASLIVEHFDIYAGFVTNFDDSIRFFLNLPSKDSKPSRREAQQVSQIFDPVAKDGGSQLFLTVHGGVHVHHEYNSQQANAVQNGVRRFLGATYPVSGPFRDELLYLHQVRADLKTHAGDRGVIESFSGRPVKLIFASEEAKKAVLDRPFPFNEAFIVDGEVLTVEGKPALYKIYSVKDVFDRP